MKKQKQEDYAERLRESFEHWQYLYEHGGSDPFYTDGTNLNLVRNHIFYYRQMIDETMAEAERPEIYFREPPPEVPNDYMARADEIRKNAKRSLAVYKADPHYRYIRNNMYSLMKKDLEKSSAVYVAGYVSGLEKAIAEDDLVTMRRHEDPKRYLESFPRCADKVQELLVNAQLSLFSLIMDTEEDEDEEYDEDEYCEDDEYAEESDEAALVMS